MEQANELVGFIAATCTTVAFVPQAMKTILSRETAGISLWMYIIFNVGVLLWLVYGLLINNYPIIIANAVTLSLAVTILWCKLTYK